MDKYSEFDLSQVFEKLLASSSVLDFDAVFSEVPSVQGVPDYVGIRFKSGSSFDRHMPQVDSEYLSSASLILSNIKRNAFRTEQYIISKTGLSRKTVRKTINHLLGKQILECDLSGNRYRLNVLFSIPNIEITAFELKIHDWKRAAFQALRYRAFANYSIIVLPNDKRNLILANLEFLQSVNIGVFLIDYENEKIEVLFKPKKCMPTSKLYTLYMQGQLLGKFRRKERVRY